MESEEHCSVENNKLIGFIKMCLFYPLLFFIFSPYMEEVEVSRTSQEKNATEREPRAHVVNMCLHS